MGSIDHSSLYCYTNLDLLHYPSSLSFSRGLKHVNYSCGACGYQLNLNSCNRNTPITGAEYQKSIKKGTISFFSIDETRFTQVEKLGYAPYYSSLHSWGLFQRRTKLLCYKCGYHIGNAYKENNNNNTSLISWDGISGARIYVVKIGALQPASSTDEDLDVGI